MNEEIQDLFSWGLEGEAGRGLSHGEGELKDAGVGDTNITCP